MTLRPLAALCTTPTHTHAGQETLKELKNVCVNKHMHECDCVCARVCERMRQGVWVLEIASPKVASRQPPETLEFRRARLANAWRRRPVLPTSLGGRHAVCMIDS
ncbi:uncharacterized [Tachysurus ichikawai]